MHLLQNLIIKVNLCGLPMLAIPQMILLKI